MGRPLAAPQKLLAFLLTTLFLGFMDTIQTILQHSVPLFTIAASVHVQQVQQRQVTVVQALRAQTLQAQTTKPQAQVLALQVLSGLRSQLQPLLLQLKRRCQLKRSKS